MGSAAITAIRRKRETSGHPEFQRVSFCARLECRMAQLLQCRCGWEFNAAEVGATSQMVSLVSKIADFRHIMNAQLSLGGKAKAAFIGATARPRPILGLRRVGAR
jgi:hypothetical protein